MNRNEDKRESEDQMVSDLPMLVKRKRKAKIGVLRSAGDNAKNLVLENDIKTVKKATKRKKELASSDPRTEATSQLHLYFNDPDVMEALERRRFFTSEKYQADVVKTIISDRYGIEIKADASGGMKEPELRIMFFPRVLDQAMEEEREVLGYTRKQRKEFREKVITEALAPELASIKAGVSRVDAAQWIREHEGDYEAKTTPVAHSTTREKKLIQQMIAEMDPAVFRKHREEIVQFFEELME